MIKKSHLSSIFITTLLLSVNIQAASQNVITDDGREVQLSDDGSWTFRSNDRFASTSDGRRIRLKEDGSWQYAKDAPPAPHKNAQDQAVKLKKIVIEKYVIKGIKNTRVKTQTVFYLKFEESQQAEVLSGKADTSLFEVKDNNGKSYPVISVKPGSAGGVIIRAEKSPGILDDARMMEITLKAGAFDNRSPVTLSMRVVDFYREDVDGFE